MYRVVQLSRLYEQIVEQIEASVLSGALKPGEQLPPERELAQRFGVSRTAVREAINALREKGLVEAFPGRGTFVTTGDLAAQRVRQSIVQGSRFTQPESLSSLAEVRELLEPEIAARAAEHAGAKDIAAMREAVAAMDAALGNADAFIEADLDFHLSLAEATDNPVFLTLIDSIVGLLREQRRRIFLAGGPERGQLYHRRVLEAIEQRNPQAARAAMQEHMKQVRVDSDGNPLFQAEADAS